LGKTSLSNQQMNSFVGQKSGIFPCLKSREIVPEVFLEAPNTPLSGETTSNKVHTTGISASAHHLKKTYKIHTLSLETDFLFQVRQHFAGIKNMTSLSFFSFSESFCF